MDKNHSILNEATFLDHIFNSINELNENELKKLEIYFAKDPELAYKYALIKQKKFPLGEPAIAKDPKYAYRYAKDILKNRFPRQSHNK